MISIVMSYYNRLPLLRYTLNTILQSQETDLEIVIVDDYSDSAHQLDNISKEFPTLKFNIIKMSNFSKIKSYFNPCVPYNVGFRASKGDKIIIQNPECCHIGDVISFVDNNLTDENYLSFHCYGSDREDLKLLHNNKSVNTNKPQPTKARWYNHKEIRPVGYHFTCAISRENLKKLNGFDERMALGHSYDDDELLQRIKFLNLNIEFIASPFVIHQFHGKSFNNPLNPLPTTDNKKVLEDILSEKNYRAPNKESIL